MSIEISIIMSVYNSDSTVSEAIESIVNQTFKNWEFIICNDASTDNTQKILNDYQTKYPNQIKVIRNEENFKLAYSLNRCLELAEGKYIARMDADDISVSNRLEIQYNFLEQNLEYDVVSTAMIPFDENGEREPRVKKRIPNKFDMLTNPVFNHATILMKKKVYDKLNGYTVASRTSRGQDYDLWFRFFSKGFKGINLDEPLYKVREGINDLKRRSFKSRIQAVHTALIGYRLLNFPFWCYIFALKPIFVGLIPKRLMFLYHKY